MWFHRISNVLLRTVLRTLLRLDIRGRENTPEAGPLIVAINHTSFLDPLIAGAFLPRTIFPLGKVELFRHRYFGWIFPAYGVIPIHRGRTDRAAIRQSLELLHGGGALLMAPEGTRSDDEQLQRGRGGIALLAARTSATILPVAIWGVRPFKANARRLRRTDAHMVVGKPFRLSVNDRKIPREKLDRVTDEVMYRVAALLPAEHRGVYRNLDTATDDYIEVTG